jgi:hypothetical protein
MAGGRPTEYRAENAEIARRACMLGATNETLAARFAVCRRTIDSWIATIPEFGDAVQQGREAADEAVVAALFDRAIGLELSETTVSCRDGETVTTTRTRRLPADTRACIFWLRNRRRGEWRENQRQVDEVDHEALLRALKQGNEKARQAAMLEKSEAEQALASAAERLQVHIPSS